MHLDFINSFYRPGVNTVPIITNKISSTVLVRPEKKKKKLVKLADFKGIYVMA
jgi:hypothetical protein